MWLVDHANVIAGPLALGPGVPLGAVVRLPVAEIQQEVL